MKLKITEHTFLKAFPLQSTAQAEIPNSLVTVSAGEEFEIKSAAPYEGAPSSGSGDHVYVQLANPPKDSDQLRWFVYGPHAKVEGTEPDNNPQDRIAVRNAGPKISIPGISALVGVDQPIYAGSNFTWAELTKGGSRVPVNATVTGRIVQIARYLDKVREFLGNQPIRVTSGYRDPKSNRNVGGARDSRHMYGDAVDFWVEGMNVVDTFYKLKQYHTNGGLAVGNGFVHLDLRPGAPARWTYGGGPRVDLW